MSEKGLLDISVELSTRNITAGNDFAVFVVVKNPFSEPVWISEVNVTLPTDLQLAEQDEVRQEAREAEATFQKTLDQTKQQAIELGQNLTSLGEEYLWAFSSDTVGHLFLKA